MFAPIIAKLKDQASHASRMLVLRILLGVSILTVAAFLMAALFVAVAERYGGLIACLILAGAFFVIALGLAIALLLLQQAWKRQQKLRAQTQAGLLRDPVVLTTLLQFARAAPTKHVVPLVAIAFGAFMLAANARKAFGDGEQK